MNINVTNLDLGYTQCEELNTLSQTKGEKIIGDLGTVITNLKLHWIGSDATVHINNLISVYNVLVAIVTEAKDKTSAAGNTIIAIQEVRRSNGASSNVGSPLSGTAPESITFQLNEETSEFNVKPEAKSDYTMLETVCTDFDAFKNDFDSKQAELFSNWLDGCDRENAKTFFETFVSSAGTYYKSLTDARDNLSIAISNMSQL